MKPINIENLGISKNYFYKFSVVESIRIVLLKIMTDFSNAYLLVLRGDHHD